MCRACHPLPRGESFGHVCVAAAEEVADNCEILEDKACDEAPGAAAVAKLHGELLDESELLDQGLELRREVFRENMTPVFNQARRNPDLPQVVAVVNHWL